MSVKTKDEILSSIKALLGDTISDEGIALLEDVSDTLDKSTGGSSDEDKKRIEELEKQVKDTDAMWRQKYTDRFLNPSTDKGNEESDESITDEDDKEDNSPKTFDELFSND
jgi:hypothetical protein